jgi:hypothetical protein
MALYYYSKPMMSEGFQTLRSTVETYASYTYTALFYGL